MTYTPDNTLTSFRKIVNNRTRTEIGDNKSTRKRINTVQKFGLETSCERRNGCIWVIGYHDGCGQVRT